MSALNLKILRRCFALIRDFLVLDRLTLIQAAEAGSLDRRDMNEYILAAALRRDKPISLLRIEPLYGALSHV